LLITTSLYLQLAKLSNSAARALAKQQQKQKQQQQRQRSGQSGTDCVSQQETAANRIPVASKAISKRSKGSSKKKTKKQLNINNTRSRMYASVQRHARKLEAAGDLLFFMLAPLGLNGKVRYLFQGVTRQQARGVLGAAMDELEWEDTRLQDILVTCHTMHS
jgi:hypothetical protein